MIDLAVDEDHRLVAEQEVDVKYCMWKEGCENEAVFRCECRIMFRKEGCNKIFCEEHRNKTKLCSCLDQKEMKVCMECEPRLKEKARKWHFYFPGFVFMIINLCALIPFIVGELDSMQ